MAHGDDDHVNGALNVEKRDIARSSEGNDQLAQEGTLPGLAARERRSLQCGETRANGQQRLLGQGEIAAIARQLSLKHEVEQPIQVRLGLAGEANPKVHLWVFAMRIRAASSLSCN